MGGSGPLSEETRARGTVAERFLLYVEMEDSLHRFDVPFPLPLLLQHHGRLPRTQINHHHVAPISPPGKTRAQGFGTGFLSGKSLGIARRPILSTLAFGAFFRAKNPKGESFTKPLKGLFNAANINQVIANTENHELRSTSA